MSRYPKPNIVLSKCLGFAACRYDGTKLRDDFVRALKPYVSFKTICPEMEIGLGTPRDPIRIICSGADSAERLIQPATGKDLTRRMARFSTQYLSGLDEIDGFILKSKSPSCGIRDTKRYSNAEASSPVGRGSGLFAAEVLRRFCGLAIEDEARLTNTGIRERFLAHIFTLAGFRAVKKSGSMKRLIRFHTQNRFLLMTLSEREMRVMDRIIADITCASVAGLPLETAFGEYEKLLRSALSRNPRRATHCKALRQAFGYVSKRLKPGERRLFKESVEKYAQKQLPLGEVTALLHVWIARYHVKQLEEQTYFKPYPPQLLRVC